MKQRLDKASGPTEVLVPIETFRIAPDDHPIPYHTLFNLQRWLNRYGINASFSISSNDFYALRWLPSGGYNCEGDTYSFGSHTPRITLPCHITTEGHVL